jgi:hypothetical protein
MGSSRNGMQREGSRMTNDTSITRRRWIAQMTGTLTGSAVLTSVLPALAHAATAPIAITVYKDPSCGCCKKWVDHLHASGFAPTVQDRSDMNALKNSLGVPPVLRSCHTAVVGKYLIEGHVPAVDIKQLLSTAPHGVLGLAAPGMPSGSPGMETPGRSDHYDVLAFSSDGNSRVFAAHG